MVSQGQLRVGKLLLLGALLVGCGRQSEPHEASGPAGSESVRIALARQPGSALAMVWQRTRPEKEGIHCEYHVSGKRALLAMLAGEADMATTGDVPVACQMFSRQDFAIVAVIGSCDDEPRILARRDHGIAEPADLRGKIVATQRGSAVHFFLHIFLLSHGLRSDDVDLRFLPAEELPIALLDGAIDAYSMREPLISAAQRQLPDQAVVFRAPGLYRRQEVLVVRRDTLAANPAAVAAVLSGLLAVADELAAGRVDLVEPVAATLGNPPAEVRAAVRNYAFRVELPQALAPALETEAQWAQESGLVPAGAMPNVLDVIEPGPLARLRPAAVNLVH